MSLRIALAASFLPAPANSGGLIRVYRLARGLAAIGEVEFFCRVPAKRAAEPLTQPELAPYSRIHLQPCEGPSTGGLLQIYNEALIPLWLADHDPLGVQMAAAHQQRPFDVLVCAQLFAANVALAVPELAAVLDEHNLESQAFAQLRAAHPRAEPEQTQTLVATIRAHEQRVWQRMQRITCVSEADAAEVRQFARSPVHVLPNGVAADELTFTPPSARTGLTVLFVGGLFWPPNIKAARFLAKEVMPRLWQTQPAARLVLCGTRPSLEVALLQRRGIEVTGTVASVAPHYAGAAVFANALFDGAGTSLKVPEALAAGVPLVSTAVGVRGHDLTPGKHYLPAESADDFVRCILQVFQDRATFDDQARQGRAFAEGLDWHRLATEFAEIVAATARVGR